MRTDAKKPATNNTGKITNDANTNIDEDADEQARVQ